MRLRVSLRRGLALLLTAGLAVLFTVAVPGTARAAADVYMVAFQGSNGDLWYYKDQGGVISTHDSGLAMAFYTHPAITFDLGGDYEIAFHGTNGALWIYEPDSNIHINTDLGMASGTSPSMATNDLVAFEANTDKLWFYTIGVSGHGTNYGMDPFSSPSISGDGNQIAFQANTNRLFIYNKQTNALINTDLGMDSASSPSIANLGAGGPPWDEVAFQANTNHLFFYDGAHGHDSGLLMYPGTDPSIDPLSNSELIAFEGSNASGHHLFVYDAVHISHVDTHLGMLAGTSPSLGPMLDSGTGRLLTYRAWFNANGTNHLYYYDTSSNSGSSTSAVVDINSHGVAYTQGVRPICC